MIKNIAKMVLIACLLTLLPALAAAEELPQIGLLIYNGTDAFMADVMSRILLQAEGKAHIEFLDSKNSQVQQNDQVEQMLGNGVDALVVNLVDRTTAVHLIRLVMPYDVPIVFINREPLGQDLALYEKAYYVGNNPKLAGLYCGELLADYFTKNPMADKNEDGVLQYVMIKGEPGHQDTELRTVNSVRALLEAGFVLEKLAEDTAMWDRAVAQEKMSTYLSTYGDRIECVIANNDEMALGAIEALKAAGYFSRGKYIPVVGVDATAAALNAMQEGTLLGTVLNDPQGLSDAAFQLAMLLAQGDAVTVESFPYEIENGSYIWTKSQKIVSGE